MLIIYSCVKWVLYLETQREGSQRLSVSAYQVHSRNTHLYTLSTRKENEMSILFNIFVLYNYVIFYFIRKHYIFHIVLGYTGSINLQTYFLQYIVTFHSVLQTLTMTVR